MYHTKFENSHYRRFTSSIESFRVVKRLARSVFPSSLDSSYSALLQTRSWEQYRYSYVLIKKSVSNTKHTP